VGGLILGLVLGVVLTAVFFLMVRESPQEAPEPPAAPAPDEKLVGELAAAKEETGKLKARVAELEEELAAREKKEEEPPAPEEEAPEPVTPLEEARSLFDSLSEKGFMAMQDPAFRRLADKAKAAGKEFLPHLVDVLSNGKNSGERFLAGMVLEIIGDREAVPALAQALAGDTDDLVRRMAAHAIAVMQAPEGKEHLRTAMGGDRDWGVRINSAYGLAKMGEADGLQYLQDTYTSADSPDLYRLGALSGLADVADPSTAPVFRQILAEKKEMSYQISAIMALRKMKDQESLPDLQRIMGDPDAAESVRDAARDAIEEIQKSD
jgi:HEAT repeat protein